MMYLRQLLGLKPAPEFAAWLEQQGIFKQQHAKIHWSDHMPEKFSRLLMH